LNAKLRDLLGRNSQFRPQQKEILGDILARVSPILAILPTAGGKSLLFQLPASIGSIGVSIVIEPLVSLLQDQQARAKKLGISSAIFNARSPPDSSRLVFTTPETFLSSDFRDFVNRLRITQQLDRVIIDECHVILNSKQSFRKRLARLGEVVELNTQLILLTATLPPRYEVDLLRNLFLESSRPKITRSSTERVNIGYSVRRVDSKEEILTIIREEEKRYSQDRLLIYTRTRELAREYSRVLDYPTYYSNSSEKERVLSDFLEGKIRVLIATSSLGLGLDVPNIRVVFHIGLPYTLYDYAQETGRAGRDFEMSEAILLLSTSSSTISYLGPRPSKDEIFENNVIQRYISNNCRRAILNSYLDGKPEEKCAPRTFYCDFCLEHQEGTYITLL